MKRSTVVAIVVAVVLVGGVGAAVAISASGGAGEAAPALTQPAVTAPAETSDDGAAPTESDAPGTSEADPAPVTPGSYVDYSDAALAAAEGTPILFFHAPWCAQCRALEADILAAGVPEGVTILKVDYDSRQDLRQKYGVTLQTTLVVVDEQGEKTDMHVAYEEPNVAAITAALGL